MRKQRAKGSLLFLIENLFNRVDLFQLLQKCNNYTIIELFFFRPFLTGRANTVFPGCFNSSGNNCRISYMIAILK